MIESNIDFEPIVITDNRLTLAVAKNLANPGFISRDTKNDIPHNNGDIVKHPDYSQLIRSGENHMVCEGSLKVSYTLDLENTQEIIEQYIEYAKSHIPDARIEVNENKIKVFLDINFSRTNWSPTLGQYAPSSDETKFEIMKGSDFVCFLRIDDEPDAWTVRYKDIIADTPTIIEKEKTHCYVFFSNPVIKNGQTLKAYKYYKLNSGNIEVIADENTKVFRLNRN